MSQPDTPGRKPINIAILSAVLAVSALLLWKLAGVLLLLFSAIVLAAALSNSPRASVSQEGVKRRCFAPPTAHRAR